MWLGKLKTDSVRVSVTYPAVFGATRTFPSFSDISKEVRDAVRLGWNSLAQRLCSTAMNSVEKRA